MIKTEDKFPKSLIPNTIDSNTKDLKSSLLTYKQTEVTIHRVFTYSNICEWSMKIAVTGSSVFGVWCSVLGACHVLLPRATRRWMGHGLDNHNHYHIHVHTHVHLVKPFNEPIKKMFLLFVFISFNTIVKWCVLFFLSIKLFGFSFFKILCCF